ncbi:MAG: T9SS type A sorting domain-containing protein [Cytophagales bacterium]|nr:T9SS type A sorting domain-containing protein [Cytophagales bacterium]
MNYKACTKSRILLQYILIIFIFNIDIYSQNLIHNAGFEDNTSNPDSDSQVDRLEVWTDDLAKRPTFGPTTHWLHSPDYYKMSHYGLRESIGIGGASINVTPHSGSGFIGMGSAELIEQKFFVNNELKEGTDYTLSMFIRIFDGTICCFGISAFDSDWDRVVGSLDFYLSKGKIKYKNNKISDFTCDDEYDDFKTLHSFTKIGTIPITNNLYPSGQWHLVSFSFVAPSSDFNWIGFEIPAVACGTYLVIDDVSLVESCPIGKECSRTFGNISPIFKSTLMADNEPFCVSSINNVSFAKLEIIALNGTIIRVYELTIPNGIDFDICWDGRTSGGNIVAAALYDYRLILSNDCKTQQYTGKLSYSGGITIDPIDYSDKIILSTWNVTPIPCCLEEIEISNQTLIGELEYVAKNSITLGPNVTISSSSVVQFTAGTEIIGLPGITVQVGADVTATIQPCGNCRFSNNADSVNNKNEDQNIFIENKNTILEKNTIARPVIAALPNPFKVNVIFEYELEQDGPVELFVSNIQGKKIEALVNETNKPAGRHLFLYYASHLKPGIYLYTLKTKDYSITKRLVVLK